NDVNRLFELKIFDYPNTYWFEYESNEISNYDLLQCKKIQNDNPLIFKLKKKVSEKRLLSYDFCFSDGPDFISLRLATLLANNK
ncbi:MAG: hypothetical protein J6581_10070, partial [Apibacter sp.]|nr:hypothetical protein [Apibacter sp.]